MFLLMLIVNDYDYDSDCDSDGGRDDKWGGDNGGRGNHF